MAPTTTSSTHVVVAIFNTNFFNSIIKRPALTASVTSLVIKQVRELGHGRDIPSEQVPDGLALAQRSIEQIKPPRDDQDAEEAPAAREARLAAWRQGEAALIKALSAGCFPALEEFKWDADPPLYDAATGAPFLLPTAAKSEETDVWIALGRSCPKLHSLTVLDSAEYNLRRTGTDNAFETVGLTGEAGAAVLKHVRPVHESSLFDAIKNLKSFNYRCYSYKHGSDPVPGDRLCRMLAACPELENLDLTLSVYGVRGLRNAEEPMYSASLDPLLTIDNGDVLPRLRRLKLLGFRAAPELAAQFLEAHPGLTYVLAGHEGSVDPEDDFGQGQVTHLAPGTLPNITEFYINGMAETWKQTLADGTKRPIAST